LNVYLSIHCHNNDNIYTCIYMLYRISISWCWMNLYLMLSSCTDPAVPTRCLFSLSTKISIKRKVFRLWAVYSMAQQRVITSWCVRAMRDKYPDRFGQYHVFVPSRLGWDRHSESVDCRSIHSFNFLQIQFIWN
jgi:hypothetical protein